MPEEVPVIPTPPVPQAAKKRRSLLVIAITATILLLIGLGVGAYFFLQPPNDSTQSQNSILRNLPGSSTSEQSQPEESGSNSANTSEELQNTAPNSGDNRTNEVEEIFTVEDSTGKNLAVTVTYTQSAQFSLEIEDIQQTAVDPTIQFYAPPPGAPFSLIRILSQNGSIIAENQFAIPTQSLGESFQDDGPAQAPTLENLNTTTALLIIELPANSTPSQVVLTTPTGSILDEQAVEQTSSRSLPIFTHIKAAAKWVLSSASVLAQQNQQKFTIVVINEVPLNGNIPELQEIARIITINTQRMVSIEPWTDFSDQIEVIQLQNDNTNLGCGPRADGFPSCPNTAQVIQRVAGEIQDWDAILVATSVVCNCGTVLPPSLPPVVALGTRASPGLIAHELGHAIGKMDDEYVYQFGGSQDYGGENCFPSIDDCRAALEDAPGFGGECKEGCNTPISWRPASLLMHNTTQPLQFGPVERCIMGRKIAEALGTQYTCPQAQPTNFFGNSS